MNEGDGPRVLTGRRRIVVLGFQKTGTTSMAAALEALGYAVAQPARAINAALDPETEDADEVVERITMAALEVHDAIQDSPCPFFHEAFDRRFPGSKFILTTRDVDDWLESYGKYFRNRNTALRRWMYGVRRFEGNEARYRDVYEERHRMIRAHFADRPGDLLEMDLGRGDGWAELVGFLGKAFLPPFPHANRGPA